MIDPRLKKRKFVKVRLLDENGKNLGIFNFGEVLKIAEEKKTGLILISEKANPPVVRLGDYFKYIYQLKKQEKKEKKSEVKEIRISFQEGEADLLRKSKQIEEFLKEGHQVRLRMVLKGRQMMHLDLAKEKINKVLESIEIPFKFISEIKHQGNNLIVLISKR